MRPLRLIRLPRTALVAAVLALTSAQAMAAAGCAIGSVSAVTFGAYDVFAPAANTGTGSFSVSSCFGGSTTYTASLSTGSGSYAKRIMLRIGSSDQLQYNLYTESSYTNILGDGTSSTVTIVHTNSGASTGPTHTIYGRIPSAQDLPVGAYTDTIVITITF